jgi:hypothetical protein
MASRRISALRRSFEIEEPRLLSNPPKSRRMRAPAMHLLNKPEASLKEGLVILDAILTRLAAEYEHVREHHVCAHHRVVFSEHAIDLLKRELPWRVKYHLIEVSEVTVAKARELIIILRYYDES